MANVLEDKGNFGKFDLCSKKVIVVALQLRVREMIPARIDFNQLPWLVVGSETPTCSRRHITRRYSW